MPEHAAASGSAAGAAIEGFLSGFHDITELRGRRSDRQRLAQLDEDERARLARLDAIEAEDRRLRHQDDERRRLIDEFMFLRDNPEVAFDTTPANGSDRIGSTRFRRGDSDEIIQGKVGQFRGNVGEEAESRATD